MKRQFKLEKYIKRFTGKEYKVYSAKFLLDGYGAVTLVGPRIIKIVEDQLNEKPVIWHEMGHVVFDSMPQTLEESEYNAQMWALRELLKLGYRKIFEASILWIKNDWLDSEKPTPSDIAYASVRARILNQITNEGIKPND